MTLPIVTRQDTVPDGYRQRINDLIGVQVLDNAPVGDVGDVGQIRAGRVLTPADFQLIGANLVGLWNLSDASDTSGNGLGLTPRDASTEPADGVTGSGGATKFLGVTSALYRADAGPSDPLRLNNGGTAGCWFRCGQLTQNGMLLSKRAAATAAQLQWATYVNINGYFGVLVGLGSSQVATDTTVTTPRLDDNRWHFAVFSWDGNWVSLYVDGKYATGIMAGGSPPNIAPPFNIGGYNASGTTGPSNSFLGLIDEAFVTSTVLTEPQVRHLYTASVSHTLGRVPSRVHMRVTRDALVSPVDAGSHIEHMDATRLLMVNDTLGVSDRVDLEVA